MNTLNRYLLWLLGIAAFAAVIWLFSDIVVYVIIARVLSILGRPLMIFFQKRIRIGRFNMGPTGAAILTIFTFYAILVGALLMFVPTIMTQASNLANADYEGLKLKLKALSYNLDLRFHELGLLEPTESLGTKTHEILQGWFQPTFVGDFLSSFISTAGNMVVTIASVTFILFFFLKEKDMFYEILRAFVPDEYEPKVQHAVKESSEMLTRYFSGLAAQLFVFSVIISVLLWLFGVENALLIGAFGGLFNIVPYVGPIIGMVFGVFITASSNLDLEFAHMLPLLLKVVGAFMLTQFIDNNFTGPMIFSKSVQAHPLEIFIVTLAAAQIGGVVGMIIGIPAYTVLRVIARTFFSEFKVVQRLTGHLEGGGEKT